MATLEELSQKLQDNNREAQITNEQLSALNTQFGMFLKGIEASRLDQLEQSREQKSLSLGANRSGGVGEATSSTNRLFPLIGLAGLTKALAAITAGIAAVAAALAGLRGWEIGALKNISKLGKNIKALFPVSIIATILKPFDGLRTRILNAFGIGADGKTIVRQGPDGKLKAVKASRIISAFSQILDPLRKISTGITGFIKGSGKALFAFIGAFISPLGGVAKLASRILYPIAILFSAKKALDAWFDAPENSSMYKIF
jgi:hypothetical protein